MSWSDLETNFQEGEATQALITRDCVKSDNVGSCNDQGQSAPFVATASLGDSLALVIDRNLHILGAKGKETEFSVQLKTPIVALTWVEVRETLSLTSKFQTRTLFKLLRICLFSDPIGQRPGCVFFVLLHIGRTALCLHGPSEKIDPISFPEQLDSRPKGL